MISTACKEHRLVQKYQLVNWHESNEHTVLLSLCLEVHHDLTSLIHQDTYGGNTT